MREECPHCNNRLVLPYGDPNSDILLVGEYPGKSEMNTGKPFTGESGEIFDEEMMRVGIDIWSCRLANLWLHPQNKNESCFMMGVQTVTKEMEGRKVLLMGSELSNYFIEDKIMAWTGMEVKSPLFPRSVQFVMMAPNPAMALHSPAGEIRLAFEKFKLRCDKEE